ncbi:hypothetical protein JDV76_10970 [Corynebacterium sp. CCM 8864]|uniref:Uncharacterized protein n=1 Tax=Corynebacterium marambiense TaxID=2765364 RepID=A0ABS0VXI0_9CORY|nr:hypothetical protein [Corynebacterium marambiense]
MAADLTFLLSLDHRYFHGVRGVMSLVVAEDRLDRAKTDALIAHLGGSEVADHGDRDRRWGLAADTGGGITEAKAGEYYVGVAEVSGFYVADLACSGQVQRAAASAS